MNLNKLYSLLSILGAFILLSSACCRRDDTLKQLTEDDKSWLPYSVGDTLFYYEGDTLVATSVVSEVIIAEGGGNKYYNKCSKEDSEYMRVNFHRTQKNVEVGIPLNFGMSYQNDTLFVYAQGFIKLERKVIPSIVIDGVHYENVTQINELGSSKTFQYIAKKGLGFLQSEKGNNRIYSIKRFRK